MENMEGKIKMTGKILSQKLIKRTFEAKKYPKGSIQRKKLNMNARTSEYMPSEKYRIITQVKFAHGGIGELKENFRTKKAAEKRYIKTRKQ